MDSSNEDSEPSVLAGNGSSDEYFPSHSDRSSAGKYSLSCFLIKLP